MKTIRRFQLILGLSLSVAAMAAPKVFKCNDGNGVSILWSITGLPGGEELTYNGRRHLRRPADVFGVPLPPVRLTLEGENLTMEKTSFGDGISFKSETVNYREVFHAVTTTLVLPERNDDNITSRVPFPAVILATRRITGIPPGAIGVESKLVQVTPVTCTVTFR